MSKRGIPDGSESADPISALKFSSIVAAVSSFSLKATVEKNSDSSVCEIPSSSSAANDNGGGRCSPRRSAVQPCAW